MTPRSSDGPEVALGGVTGDNGMVASVDMIDAPHLR
jgi:hypothetical protein